MFQAPLNVLKRLMQACRRNPWGIGGVGCFIPSSDGPFLFSISNYQRSESRRRIRVTVWREHTCQRPLRSEDRAEKDRSCLCTHQECPICENKREWERLIKMVWIKGGYWIMSGTWDPQCRHCLWCDKYTCVCVCARVVLLWCWSCSV